MPAHFEPIICECCGKRAGGIIRWYRCGNSFAQRSPYEAVATISGGGSVATLKGFIGPPPSFSDQRTCLDMLGREGYEVVTWDRANGIRAEHPIERPRAMSVSGEGTGQ